jgi:hypothetical protein
LRAIRSISDKAERSFRSLATGKRRVPETNPLRETSERCSWTKPLSSLCGLIQFGKPNRRTEIIRGGMANAVEFVNPMLGGRTLGGFAGIRFAAAFAISRRVHGAGKLRAQRCVDEKIEAANCERQRIVMTNRSLGVVVEAAESRPCSSAPGGMQDTE